MKLENSILVRLAKAASRWADRVTWAECIRAGHRVVPMHDNLRGYVAVYCYGCQRFWMHTEAEIFDMPRVDRK